MPRTLITPPFPAGNRFITSPVGGAAPFIGALDAFTDGIVAFPSIAYRRFSAYEGPLIRVRRSSDNTEQDIAPLPNGILDTATLLTFAGAVDAFIVTIYNQAGAASNFTQSTAANQRRIVSSGVLDTLNGLPSGYAPDGSRSYVATMPDYTGTTATGLSRFSVKVGTPGDERILAVTSGAGNDFDNGNQMAFFISNTPNLIRGYRLGNTTANHAIAATTEVLASAICTGSSFILNVGGSDSSNALFGNFGVNRILLGSYSTATHFCPPQAHLTESGLWLADKSADIAAIRAALLA